MYKKTIAFLTHFKVVVRLRFSFCCSVGQLFQNPRSGDSLLFDDPKAKERQMDALFQMGYVVLWANFK